MAFRWFRIPKASSISQTGGTQIPGYVGLDGVEKWACANDHPAGPPIFVVRIVADTATLDEIEAGSGVSALSDNQVENALNNMPSVSGGRTIGEWNEVFNP